MALEDILPGTLGFGTAPLGNMFRDIPDDEARATVEAAWDDGIRYFDTAPLYGAGLAELRLGEALAERPRADYVISTKVGRLILDEKEDVSARDQGEKGGLFAHGRDNRVVNDYSYDATLRSIEDSLERLRTDRIDIAWVHDVAQDFYGDSWLEKFESARTGAFRALDRLRDEKRAFLEYQKASTELERATRLHKAYEWHTLQRKLAQRTNEGAAQAKARLAAYASDVAAFTRQLGALDDELHKLRGQRDTQLAADGEQDAQIARAIIAMAHSLNLSVIAEGVETQEQLDFLREHDCDEVQGYLFGKPMPADQFEARFGGNALFVLG